MQLAVPERSNAAVSPRAGEPRRALLGAGLAHVLHDGYTDLLYVLLPVWQAEFGLSYAALAMMRCLYNGTMGGLQVLADRLMARLSFRAALSLSTIVAAAGFLLMGLTGSFYGLCAGLVLSGMGSSVQHPRASLLVTRAYGTAARRPLGMYNFAGDLGKAVFPVAVALLLGALAWRSVALLMALVGLLTALALTSLVPDERTAQAKAPGSARTSTGDRMGFRLLLASGALDTATRMGFLLFLPFLIRAKGGSETVVGVSLALIFAGGALGKAGCGWIGERYGVVRSVIATEAATALLIVTSLALPLGPCLVLLPVLGIVLNGTSSVLYGTVPELAPSGDTGPAFALFYTGVIGAGGIAPIAYGALGDGAGERAGVVAAALTALAIVPLALALRGRLGERGAQSRAHGAA